MDPATGAIDSLLPKLESLLTGGKLRNKARKQVVFLHDKLTRMQLALSEADPLSLQIKEWLTQARPLSYGIEHVVDKFEARRLRAAHPPAADRHQLIRNIRSQMAIAKASGQFATDIQSYRGRIMELDIQLIIRMDPAKGAIGSLLPKLQGLLTSGKLRKKARKEVAFLLDKLTRIHGALGEVEDVQGSTQTQARALSYGIEQIVDKLLDPPAADRHTLLTRNIRLQLAFVEDSRRFAKDIQSYRDPIMELDLQLAIRSMGPARGAIDSLLTKLEDLLTSGNLRKKARKEVVFLQEKLTGMQHALGKVKDVQWARHARALSYHIVFVVDKFMAHRLRVADRHKLIGRIRSKMAIAKASSKFAKDIQGYRDRVMELDIQPISYIVPATGAIDSLLPKLHKLLIAGKLRKKARKQVVFLQEKLTRIQHAFRTVEDMPADQHSVRIKEWAMQGRVLSYDIEHVVHEFLTRRLSAADPPASDRHKLIGRIKSKMAIAKASNKFVKDIQSYRGRITELDNASSSLSPTHADFPNTADLIPSPRHDIAPSSPSPSHDIAPSSLSPTHADFPNTAAPIPSPRHDIAPSSPSPSPSPRHDIAPSSPSPTHDIAPSSPSPRHDIAPSSPSPTHDIAPSSPSPRHDIAIAANDHDDSVEELVDHEVLVKKILADEDGEGITSNRQPMIASILGGAGVGKTKLVDQMYQKLNSLFECTAWITVSQEPDIKNALWNILCQISLQDDATFGSLTVNETIGEIRKALNNKRYFIVVEDLWDITAREIIKCALIENRKGSVILMTSHKVSVAHFPGVEIYRVGPLSENPSRELFGAGDKCPDLLAMPEKIVKKSSGIPSAISNAANLLAGEAKENWHTMLGTSNSEDSYDAGMTSQQLGEDNLSEFMKRNLTEEVKIDAALTYRVEDMEHESIVSMSAEENPVTILNKRLPEKLKSCLLYLSMFRNGYEISEDRLISGWIAEGYIPEHEGEERLKDLRERDLIEAVKTDADGKDLCSLSDTGRKLIASFSAEENSVTILEKREGQPLPQTAGRLAIQGHDVDLAQEQVSIVRSLIVSDDANSSNDESSGAHRSKRSSGANVMSFLSRFENLRVLELGGCGSLQNDHLNGIKSLILLRYLVIGGGITSIPKDIDTLVFLQTLDLRATSVEELPGTIVRAMKLKCLRVNGRTKMPRGLRKMEALQELGDMSMSNAELLKELSDLTNLKILRIVIWSWDDGYKDALLDYLGSLSKKKLQRLSVFTCCSLQIFGGLKAEDASKSLEKLEIRRSAFLSLPLWISSLDSLSSLSIEVYKLSQEIINILGEMENLRTLWLKSKQAPLGKFTDAGFRILESFSFVTNALGEIFQPGAMEKVERLHLSFQASCTKTSFDFGLQYLPSLKSARVEILCFNANHEMVDNAKKAIEKAIENGRKPGSKDPKLDFDLLDKIEPTESETQTEHDTVQENQQTSPSTLTPASKEIVPSSPAQFCDRCGSEFPRAEYQFCPGCGTRRLTVQRR